MKPLNIILTIGLLFPLLSSCSDSGMVQKRIVIGESELVTLPSGKQNYYPISKTEDLENAIFVQESTGSDTVHYEFDLNAKKLIERKNGEQTSSIIHSIQNVRTYLDVYEVTTADKIFQFIKVGPRLIVDEEGIRYSRVN